MFVYRTMYSILVILPSLVPSTIRRLMMKRHTIVIHGSVHARATSQLLHGRLRTRATSKISVSTDLSSSSGKVVFRESTETSAAMSLVRSTVTVVRITVARAE